MWQTFIYGFRIINKIDWGVYMGKSFNTRFMLVLALLAFMLTACSESKTKNNQLPEKKPSDFYFVLNYGINAKNQLDTQKGTYTKDMVTAPSVTTALKLSDKEVNEIYTSMRNINILSYPDNFNPKSNMGQKPFLTYSIKIIVNGKEKNIYWNDEFISSSKEAVNLRALFKRIHEIISSKEEYKKLPAPQGGYD